MINITTPKRLKDEIPKYLELHTNNSSVCRSNNLFGSRWKFDSGLFGLGVVGDDCGIVSRCTSKLASVSRLLLQTADNGTLRHGANREHISNVQLGCNNSNHKPLINTCISTDGYKILRFIFNITLLAAVDELAGVDPLSCNEQFCPLLKPVWVTESYFSQRSPTAWIVNNILGEKAY